MGGVISVFLVRCRSRRDKFNLAVRRNRNISHSSKESPLS